MSEPREEEKRPAAVLRAADIESRAQTFSHPWNPLSQVTGTRMSMLGGLQRTGLSRVRVEPGKESFAYHSHHFEEEWLYILSGRAVLRIEGVDHEVGPGDFVAFPAPSQSHQLANPFDDPVEYLMGGESREFEIADFPELNRRLLRFGERAEVMPLDVARPMVFEPPRPREDREEDADGAEP